MSFYVTALAFATMVQRVVIAVCAFEEKADLGITVFWEWDTGVAAGAIKQEGLCRVCL